MRALACSLLLLLAFTPCLAAEQEKYLLAADLHQEQTTAVEVTLEVGGELLVLDEQLEAQRAPLAVEGKLKYVEQLVAAPAEDSQLLRSLRKYETAHADIKQDKSGVRVELPESQSQIVAEFRDGRFILAGENQPLSREEFDLVNVVGNTLALNQLLPGEELAEGDRWNHNKTAIAALLGMDHVAVCEVSSVVTGSEHRQVKIRLAGTVHGTIDGAPTEMELRGAYLFHMGQKRITKFNLAIKEQRTATQVVPGLDCVAKVHLVVSPSEATLTDEFAAEARDLSQPLAETLRYESRPHSFRLLQDMGWFVTAEESELVSFHLQRDGDRVASCKISTLPARSEGRESSLEEFEKEVRETLGEVLDTVSASTEWTTSQGYQCLAVVGQGQVQEVPIEWRYYLISSPNLPRVSLAVTVEQSRLEQFDDAERQMVESLELLAPPAKTAEKSQVQATK